VGWAWAGVRWFNAGAVHERAGNGRASSNVVKSLTNRWTVCSGSTGDGASAAESVDTIVETLVKEAQPGDVIALLSNGAFGGIHARLLAELAG